MYSMDDCLRAIDMAVLRLMMRKYNSYQSQQHG